jgi:hypothetical protein
MVNLLGFASSIALRTDLDASALTASEVELPANISIVANPSKCLGLNLRKNIWQIMRGTWLSNWVFSSCDDIVDHCCDAGNRPVHR